MALNVDAKFEGKPTFSFKNDMRNWENFHQSSCKGINIWTLIWFFYPNSSKIWMSLNLQRSCLSWKWKKMQNWRSNWLVISTLIWGLWKFWPELLKTSKVCTLMGCLWPKYIMFELNKYRGVTFGNTEYWCKIWKKTDFCFQKWHEEFGKLSPEHLKLSKFGLRWDSFI